MSKNTFKDYGSEYPVSSLREKVETLILAVTLIVVFAGGLVLACKAAEYEVMATQQKMEALQCQSQR